MRSWQCPLQRSLKIVWAVFLAPVLFGGPQTSGSPSAHPQPQATTRRPASKLSAAKPAAPAPALMTDEQKTIYALGLSIYRSLGPFNLSQSELAIVKQALSDAAAHKPALELEQWGPKIQPLARERAGRLAEEQRASSKNFLDKAAAEPGAVRTASGLVYRDVTVGTGPSPKPTDTVKVNYRGTLVDGTEFDSSYKRNAPAEFALNGVIPCWTEGMQKMKVGGKAVLVCPSDLAYGDRGQSEIPGGATLTFEIELLAVTPAAP